MPALYHLYKDEKFIRGFSILSAGLSQLSDDAYRDFVESVLKKFSPENFDQKSCSDFVRHLHHLSGSAEKDDKDLKSFFNLKKGEFPEFDLILLGIGEDGHTVSLFPGDSALLETHRLTAAVHLDNERHERVTLTLPVINHTRNIIFLVLGENKAEIIREVLENPQSDLPASRVRTENGRLFFLLDKAASLLLSEKNSALKK